MLTFFRNGAQKAHLFHSQIMFPTNVINIHLNLIPRISQENDPTQQN